MQIEAAALLTDLQKANPEDLQKAVIDEACERLATVINGISSYKKYPFKHTSTDHSTLWQAGSTRLLDYRLNTERRTPNTPPILFVPSLINRSYIFDLFPEHSMIRFLRDQGMDCLLVDWGDPSDAEKSFGLNEYITLRLNKAIEKAVEECGRPIVLAGYCMGGLMAMAAIQESEVRSQKSENREQYASSPTSLAGVVGESVQLKEKSLNPKSQTLNPAIKALILIATPWDFHSPDIQKVTTDTIFLEAFTNLLNMSDTLSGEVVHQLLYFMGQQGLWSAQDRYKRFSSMPEDSSQARYFIGREHWLHDNVALTRKVAAECFVDWAVHNTTGRMHWKINNRIVNPAYIKIPTLLAIPEYDRIVPPLCAQPLADLISNITVIRPPSGHLGMVAGTKAKEYLWLPIEKWVRGV